jgi:uncharacterized protein involved in exopolysaccharide biosynthesis
MFDYGSGGSGAPAAKSGEPAPARPGVGARENARALVRIASKNRRLIVTTALAGAVLAFAASKLATPRYVATSQIYIDPGSLPGASKDALAPGQDSNGFINYVESQAVIIASRVVLARVVADEKLDADPEFAGAARFPALFSGGPPNLTDAAIAALATRIQVRRPERTFVIDLSVSDRDADKAAELANAVAKAYIQVSQSLQADAFRQAEASLKGRIETLRKQVVEAEKKVEDFKTANDLGGVTEQQLRDMNAQITVARTREAAARAQLDLVDSVRKGVNTAALASQITSATLAALRAQQAQAEDRLANLSAELGPRHPSVIDAAARLRAANDAVQAELSRFAAAQRVEYESAAKLEAALNRQLKGLQDKTNENSQKNVDLRDLEREADAARGVYDLFVTRSREAGDIQQVEPSRTRIISQATPPKSRSFPPSGALLAAAGLAFGLGAGLALAIARENNWRSLALAKQGEPSSQTPSKPEPIAPRRSLSITARSRLRAERRAQSLDRLELTGLGFPVLDGTEDGVEFDAILDALFSPQRGQSTQKRSVCVFGRSDSGLRTALTLSLALCAARRGVKVAVIDAAERNPRLTRAIRHATTTPVLDQGAFYRSVDGVLVGLPRSYDPKLGRLTALEILRATMRPGDEAASLIFCDGPDPSDPGMVEQLQAVDDVIALEATAERDDSEAIAAALKEAGVATRASVRFEPAPIQTRKTA